MSAVAMILIGIFGMIAVLFLADVIVTVEPYFRKWLQRKLEKVLETKNCNNCKYRTTDYEFYEFLPPRHYCNMHGKDITRDSSCDRWGRR